MNHSSTVYQNVPAYYLKEERLYKARVDAGVLKKNGDFGLASPDKLSGEFILLDGVAYAMDIKGNVFLPGDDFKIAFCLVTFFSSDKKFMIKEDLFFEDLLKRIKESFPSANRAYAIKCYGLFSEVLFRSINPHEDGVLFVPEDQPSYVEKEIRGCVVGYYFPEYFENIGIPGFHFHFINESKTLGGHMYHAHPREVTVEIQVLSGINIGL